MNHPHFSQSAADYTHSFRLTFAYVDNDIHLARTERIAMISPAAAGPPPASDQTGYWVEVSDAEGRLLYHRALHDPTRADIEVFGDEPGEPIYRTENRARSGEFEVIVPDLPHAARVSLHGPSPRARKPHGPSKERLTHDFAELRRLDREPPSSVEMPDENGDQNEGRSRS